MRYFRVAGHFMASVLCVKRVGDLVISDILQEMLRSVILAIFCGEQI